MTATIEARLRVRRRRTVTAIVGLVLLLAPGLPLRTLASVSTPPGTAVHTAGCAVTTRGAAGCDAWYRVPGPDAAGGSPTSGYTPAQLQQAYRLPSTTNGAGQTVAVVDAYDDPTAVTDLETYRAVFGLSICSGAIRVSGCTFANGATFRKVSQTGGQTYPVPNAGWAEEISLDLDMVSAICPRCNILLVEAGSNSFADLGAAVDEAAALRATEISNSYGGAEWSGELADDAYYQHPGIAVTASTGDLGYGVQFPADAPSVIAVGGTTLSPSSTSPRGWTETAWTSGGSGCSTGQPQPAWQAAVPAIAAACATRAVADVSADANPSTGVTVFDQYSVGGSPHGWLVFGGTSVASPIIASTYALAGNAASVTAGAGGAASLYTAAAEAALNDVTSGSNGSCGGSVLCTAGPGWDGPTGLGTPDGIAAF